MQDQIPVDHEEAALVVIPARRRPGDYGRKRECNGATERATEFVAQRCENFAQWLGSGDLELAAKLVIEARRIWVLRLIAFPMIIPASLAVLGLVSISDRSKEWIAGPPILLLLIYAWLVVMFGRTHTQIDAKSKVRTLFQRPHLLDLGRNRSES